MLTGVSNLSRAYLELEYKYLIKNSDGNVDTWKPGENYSVNLQLQQKDGHIASVTILDAWYGTSKVKWYLKQVSAPVPPPSAAKAASKQQEYAIAVRAMDLFVGFLSPWLLLLICRS
jgi:hypothetical protein